MPPSPDIQPLAYKTRSRFFLFILTIFLLAVPFLIFYAIGYRFHFNNDDVATISTVGGMYVSAEAENSQMFIDEKQVTDFRIFQRAAYIQNLSAGTHRLHVQGDGIQTWVKELPVFSHIVTEAESFNMPATSTVRVVTNFLNPSGVPVLSKESQQKVFSNATTSQTFTYATSTAVTSTYETNPEWEYLMALFAASSTEVVTDVTTTKPKETFRFATEQETIATATTTVSSGDMWLYEKNGDVFASWRGEENGLPYYFCVRYDQAPLMAKRYGDHVAAQIYAGTILRPDVRVRGDYVCRTTIRINDLNQAVRYFGFLPGSRNHVVLQLEDGLYVTEIDDRGWQNTQRIYAGDEFKTIIDSAQIFVHDGERFFEVLTTALN